MSTEAVNTQEVKQEIPATEANDASQSNWDALLDIETEVLGTEKEAAKPADETDENQENGTETKTDAKDDTKKEEKTDENQEQGKEGENKEESAEEEKPLIEFKAEDVNNAVSETEPEDGTWLAVAKASGLEIQDDSFEAYQSAVEAKYNAQIEQVKAQTEDTILAKYSPEARMTIELLNSGLSLEEVYAPTQMIKELKSLDDAALVRKNLEETRDAQGNPVYDSDFIDKEIETLIEKGNIDHEAKRIRKKLELIEQEIQLEHSQKLKQFQEKKAQIAEQTKHQSVAQFTNALNTVSEFMGGKLSDEAKQAIVKKQQAGLYDNLLNDPKKLAEFVLYNEFGQKAIKNLENTAYQRGREEKTKKLVNVPPVNQTGASRTITNQPTNNWDAIKEGFGG